MSNPTKRYFPDFDTFKNLAANADLVPVYRRLIGDSLTPVTAFHKIDAGRCACLFESVIGGERVGRYSFLATEPFFEIESYGNRVTINTLSSVSASGDPVVTTQQFESDDPLQELRQRIEKVRAATLPDLPPFCGGAVGYAGYDMVRHVEHLPNAPHDDRHVPDMTFAFYDQMVIFDHITKTFVVIVMAKIGSDNSQAAYDSACRRVDDLVDQLAHQPCDLEPVDIATTDRSTEKSDQDGLAYCSNFPRKDYESAVEKCVEYIQDGDIFQVVISQRLEVPICVHPFEIYRTLRVVNPSPFMFYVRTPSVTLVGSSPEIMVRVIDGKVTVRPLAGTRPRGATESEDIRLEQELLADEKERAEHVMLVDLGRNDVGRVTQYGSVQLSDVMTIERYSHVMHITSNVSGQLRSEMTAFDALQACLPAGTVSGAPKIRAMEIIDEMEPHRRGPYAGAVGYIDYNGNMDTCLALRTIVVHGEKAYIQAGAGIVADSVSTNEWHETLNKARGLLRAIELAQKGGEEDEDPA